MGLFFAHSRGSVKRLVGPWAAPAAFQVSLGGRLRPFTSSIVTQVGAQSSGNFQFLHTLDDTVFVYVFGNQIGELTVSGVSFASDCDNGGQEGLSELANWYENNKISVRALPVVIGLGRSVTRGFLTGIRIDVSDAETQLGQWSLRFNTIPARTAPASGFGGRNRGGGGVGGGAIGGGGGGGGTSFQDTGDGTIFLGGGDGPRTLGPGREPRSDDGTPTFDDGPEVADGPRSDDGTPSIYDLPVTLD